MWSAALLLGLYRTTAPQDQHPYCSLPQLAYSLSKEVFPFFPRPGPLTIGGFAILPAAFSAFINSPRRRSARFIIVGAAFAFSFDSPPSEQLTLHIRLFHIADDCLPAVVHMHMLDAVKLLPAVTQPSKNLYLGRISPH
jgi:hypothetical protein